MGTIPPIKINFKPTIKQHEAFLHLEDPAKIEILFGGGAGGAKSYLGCTWLLLNCLRYAGSRWLMGRAVLKTLKETTLNTFFQICHEHKLVPTVHYTYNQQNGTIKFFNGSEILLKDVAFRPSDPQWDSLGSLEICGAFLDEVAEIHSKAKNIVRSRCRYKLDEFGITPKLLMSCNPTKGWAFIEFYKPYFEGNEDEERAYVQALVYDNPHIPKSYIRSLEKLDKASRERLLLGNWFYDGDPRALIEYDKMVDLWTNDHVPTGRKYITADVAGMGSDLMVFGVWDGFRKIHTETLSKNDGKQALVVFDRLKKKYGIPNSNIVYDADGIGSYLRGFLRGAKPFVNNSTALKGENYSNLKTQCYFLLAKYINEGRIFVTHEEYKTELCEELEQVKRDKVDTEGKLRLVAKSEVRLNIGRSPDFSDEMAFRMYFELKKDPKTQHLNFI